MNNKKKYSKRNPYSKAYIMYGKHAVISALSNPCRIIKKVYCTADYLKDFQYLIEKYEYEIVQSEHLSNMLPKNTSHQNIAVLTESIFKEDITYLNLNHPACKLVILDQITDIQNIGAIIRSAAAFNIDAIIVTVDNSPEENAALAKAAVGTLEVIPIVKVVNLKQTIDYLKKKNFWIIGLDSNTDQNISADLLAGKVAIIMGSEGKGMRKLTKENCDHILKIPMSNKTESLNVSNAAAIAFYLAYNS